MHIKTKKVTLANTRNPINNYSFIYNFTLIVPNKISPSEIELAKALSKKTFES